MSPPNLSTLGISAVKGRGGGGGGEGGRGTHLKTFILIAFTCCKDGLIMPLK